MRKFHRTIDDVSRIVFWLVVVAFVFGMLHAAGGDINGFFETMLDTGNRLASLVVMVR